MPGIDLPLAELVQYRSTTPEPADFDEVWATTLAQARTVTMAPTVVRVPTALQLVDTYDVTFPGFAGDPVRAWLTVPAGAAGRLPVVVQYNGYGGGRGLPVEHLAFASAGYAHLFMDTRGQGSTWGTGGVTPDPHGSAPSHPGYMTRGIESFETYYYRRLITDAVRAVDTARVLPQVDPERVVVAGGSQGGALTLAAAGLSDGLVGVMPDVPFCCDFRRAVQVSDSDPYGEISRYLTVHRHSVEQVFGTLAYVDGVSFAARATAPTLFSVALWDHICPPSTVYAAYNAYAGPKQIEVYQFNDHEGGMAYQLERQLEWLGETVGLPSTAR